MTELSARGADGGSSAGGLGGTAGRGPVLDPNSELRMNIYPSQDDYLALKAKFAEAGNATALRWDSRRASKGPYIDLTVAGDKVDLADLARFQTPAAKVAFEAAMAAGGARRASGHDELRAAATGLPQAPVPANAPSRINLYPSKEQNAGLKERLKAVGAEAALRWDRNPETVGFYLDMTRPGAEKINLAELATYRTAEAEAVFRRERAEGERARESGQAEVQSAAAERMPARSGQTERERGIPEDEKQFAERPLWMPAEKSPRFKDVKVEVLAKSSPAILSAFRATETFINQTRETQRLLQENEKDLDQGTRGKLVAAIAGKDFLREVLVMRGFDKFKSKPREAGAAVNRGAGAGKSPAPAAAPRDAVGNAPAPEAAAARQQNQKGAAAPKSPSERAADDALATSEAARLAASLGRG